MFIGAQLPRLLTRAICLYIDPHAVAADPDFRFAEAELQPRLLFEDAGLWETVRKLKAQIGSADPAARLYAEALGGLLSVELLRLLQVGAPASRPSPRSGLAMWQQKRVMDFIEEHLSEDVSLNVLADLVRFSPYHFCDPLSNPSGSRHIATGRAGGLNAPRPCWRTHAHRSPRLRSVWDSVARARSVLPFIGSQGKHLPTIAATSDDAWHDVSPAEAVQPDDGSRATAAVAASARQRPAASAAARAAPRWVFRQRRPKAGSRSTSYGRFLEEMNSFLRVRPPRWSPRGSRERSSFLTVIILGACPLDLDARGLVQPCELLQLHSQAGEEGAARAEGGRIYLVAALIGAGDDDLLDSFLAGEDAFAALPRLVERGTANRQLELL